MQLSSWNDDEDTSNWRDQEGGDFEDANSSDDWDDDGSVPCPNCGESMFEDADYCPSCDRWISAEDTPRSSYPVWTKIVAALLLATILVIAVRGL